MKAVKNKLATRVGSAVALGCSMTFAAPVLAFAAEEESAGITAILPDMDEFIPMLIAFLILLAVLAKFGWPVFDKILVKREATIRENLEKSEQARIESERVLEEYQERLIDARHEAQTIVAEAKQRGEAQRAEIIAQAQEEADRTLARARDTIEVEKKAAIGELQASVADITVDAMTRIISEDFSDEEHRKLIERSLEKVGSLDA